MILNPCNTIRIFIFQVTATQLLTLPSVPTVYLVGWVLPARTSAPMDSKCLWTVETVYAIHATQGADAMWSVQDTELASTINASVIQFKDGGALCAKCPDVLDPMGGIVVGMVNVTAQTISAFANQVRTERFKPGLNMCSN